MIDGIKILSLPVNENELRNNELLDFIGKDNRNTGEVIEYPVYAKYNSLEFEIKDNSGANKKRLKDNKPLLEQRIFINLNGSIHKYHNKGKHNYNDFYYFDLLTAIIDLCEKFNINPFLATLNGVEFGVNIIVLFDIKVFLDSIISHKGKEFIPFEDDKGTGIECVHTDYIIKIYYKSFQYEQSENILRFEIKVRQMKYFSDNKVNIKYLFDLLNPDLFLPLGAILKTVFNEILFYDYSIYETNLNDKERLILSNGRNAKLWKQSKPNSKNYTAGTKDSAYKKEYKKKRKIYDNLILNYKLIQNKYSTSTIQKDTSELIEKKYKELSNFNENLRGKLATFKNRFNEIESEIFNDFKIDEKGQIRDSGIMRICPVTKLDISMQKPESKFLCIAGIKYYYENEKEIYYQLEKRLSAKWRSELLKTQFREIAHSIRNEYFNKTNDPRNNFKKRIEKIKKYPVLFDTDSYLMLTVLQRQLLEQRNSIYKN